MKSIFQTIVVLILLGGWLLAAAALHVVRKSDGGWGVIPKNRLGVADTYLDLATWTPRDAYEHPDFVRRLIAAGKTHWLSHLFPGAGDDIAPQLEELLSRTTPPESQPAATPPTEAEQSPIRHLGVK